MINRDCNACILREIAREILMVVRENSDLLALDEIEKILFSRVYNLKDEQEKQ